MDSNLTHEVIKYGSMFLFISIAILILSIVEMKYKTFRFRWYHGLIVGFAVGFVWPSMFNWLFGW